MIRRIALVLLAVASGFFTSIALAQPGTASVSGRVLDAVGAVIPGASVSLERAGAAPLTVQSDTSGGFRFDGVAAGGYTLRVSLPGFGTATKSIEVAQSGERSVDVTLHPQGLSETVTVSATRTPQEIAAIPGSVSVIPRRVLVEQQLPSIGLGDTLGKLVPGLAAANSSNSQFGQTLRGRTLSVLIDGVPQSTTRNGQRDLETINPDAIERVEVLRGPTAIYGDGATGGVINIITRVPGAGPAQFATDFDLSSSLSHPDDSYAGRIWQSAAGRAGRFDYSLSGAYESLGAYFDAEGDRVPPDPNNQGGLADSDNLGLFGKLGYAPARQRLQLTTTWAHRRQNTDYTSDPIVNTQAGHQKARALFGLELENPQGADNTIVNLDYRHDPLWSTEPHAQVYYRDYSTTFFPRDSRTLAARGNIVNQAFIDSSKVGGRLELVTTPKGQRAPVILWGVDLADEDTEQPVWVLDTPAFVASGGRVYNVVGRRSWTPPMNQKSIAGFLQLEWKPVQKLILRAGVRRESFKVDVDDFTVLQGFAISGGKLDYKATPVNAGVVFQATPSFNTFFNFSQGFSLADIGLVLRAAPRNFTVTQLKPEAQKVDNYELGLRLNKGSFAASLAGFYNTSDFGTSFAPDFTLIQSPEKIYGVEATVDHSSNEKLHLGLTASWLEGKNDPNLDGVYTYMAGDRIAPPKFTAYIDHQTTRRWRNRIQGLYNGSRNRFGNQGQPDAIGRIGFGLSEVESYFLVDFFSYLKVGKGTLRLAIQNTLNDMYFPPASQWSGQDSTYAAAQGAVLSLGYTIRY